MVYQSVIAVPISRYLVDMWLLIAMVLANKIPSTNVRPSMICDSTPGLNRHKVVPKDVTVFICIQFALLLFVDIFASTF